MKVYGVFNMDQCYKMMLGQPILRETFTNKEEAEKRAAELSDDEKTIYSATDFYFNGPLCHNKDEFIEEVKKKPGFLYLSSNLGNDNEKMVVIYDKHVRYPNSFPEMTAGCVAVDVWHYEASRYEVREIEVKD